MDQRPNDFFDVVKTSLVTHLKVEEAGGGGEGGGEEETQTATSRGGEGGGEEETQTATSRGREGGGEEETQTATSTSTSAFPSLGAVLREVLPNIFREVLQQEVSS